MGSTAGCEVLRANGARQVSTMSTPASMASHLSAEGDLVLDFDDEITAAVCVTAAGEIRSDLVRRALEEGS